jgi:hypothetical protein
MKIPRSLALVIIASTGAVGFFLGRAVQEDAPREYANASTSAAPSGTPAANSDERECEAERTALDSIKAQLAACLTTETAAPKTAPSSAPEKPAPILSAILAEEIKSYQERLEGLSEAVIVRHSSGKIRVYKPDEWPSDGDGVIVGRKFKDGRIERYPSGALR